MVQLEPSSSGGGMQTAGDGLRIDTMYVDGHVVLAIAGEIDLATAPSFGAAIEQATLQAGRVVLDFTGVTFMDSSGLNVLVAAVDQGADAGVVVRNAPLSVHRLLKITGLDEVIRIEGEPIDARRAAS